MEVDVQVVNSGQGDGGVEHGERLIAFVDAAMGVTPEETADARARLESVLGERGVVDAAAVTAMFQLNTRAADSAGIPIEEAGLERRSEMGVSLGFTPRVDGSAP